MVRMTITALAVDELQRTVNCVYLATYNLYNVYYLLKHLHEGKRWIDS